MAKQLVADEKTRITRNSKSKYKTVVLTADKFEDMQGFFPFFRLVRYIHVPGIMRKI
jgi:hypothetical protein